MSVIEITILLSVYLSPLIVAFGRGAQRRWPMAFVLVVTGWTLFGWVGVLIWAFADKSEKQAARERAELQAREDRARQPVHVHVHHAASAPTTGESS